MVEPRAWALPVARRSQPARAMTRWLTRRALPAVLALALPLASSSEASAYVLKQTSSGRPVRWAAPKVTFSIDPALEQAVAGAAAATVRAMTGWSGISGAPEMELVQDDPDAPVAPGYDGKNGIFYASAADFPGGPRELALTVITFDQRTGAIVDADIVVNGAHAFELLDADAPPGTFDIQHVLAHELGHCLGMADERRRPDALMYYATRPQDTSLRTPRRDDLAGLAALYSAESEETTSCSASPAPVRSSAAAVVALGLIVALRLRRRGRAD